MRRTPARERNLHRNALWKTSSPQNAGTDGAYGFEFPDAWMPRTFCKEKGGICTPKIYVCGRKKKKYNVKLFWSDRAPLEGVACQFTQKKKRRKMPGWDETTGKIIGFRWGGLQIFSIPVYPYQSSEILNIKVVASRRVPELLGVALANGRRRRFSAAIRIVSVLL